MRNNVINLGILSDTSLLESGIKGRYYIYYKSDGDLYLYNSFKNKEINIFRLGTLPKGVLSFLISKTSLGSISFDFVKNVTGKLSFNFTKKVPGNLLFDITKISSGKLSFDLTKSSKGTISVYVKEYTV